MKIFERNNEKYLDNPKFESEERAELRGCIANIKTLREIIALLEFEIQKLKTKPKYNIGDKIKHEGFEWIILDCIDWGKRYLDPTNAKTFQYRAKRIQDDYEWVVYEDEIK